VKNKSSHDKEEQQDKAKKKRRIKTYKKNEEFNNLRTSDFRLKFWL